MIPATASHKPCEPQGPMNAMALVAFALSVVGTLLPPAALGGIICGHLARRQIRQRQEGGDTWALAALILGYLLILMALAGLLLFGGIFITILGIMALA